MIAAFHLITGVAQAHPTPDGTWLGRLSAERIAEYVEVARDRGMLVFLDNQIGWSDPLTEVKLLEPFLREPFVHVAIDPEFATKRQGERPGLVIGSVTAGQVNEVQRYLAALVQEEGLPPKILMVHQFTPGMLRDRGAVADVDGVDLSIDMDGFGGIAIKLAGYDVYSLREPSEWPALKLFFIVRHAGHDPRAGPGARPGAGPDHLPVARRLSREPPSPRPVDQGQPFFDPVPGMQSYTTCAIWKACKYRR